MNWEIFRFYATTSLEAILTSLREGNKKVSLRNKIVRSIVDLKNIAPIDLFSISSSAMDLHNKAKICSLFTQNFILEDDYKALELPELLWVSLFLQDDLSDEVKIKYFSQGEEGGVFDNPLLTIKIFNEYLMDKIAEDFSPYINIQKIYNVSTEYVKKEISYASKENILRAKKVDDIDFLFADSKDIDQGGALELSQGCSIKTKNLASCLGIYILGVSKDKEKTSAILSHNEDSAGYEEYILDITNEMTEELGLDATFHLALTGGCISNIEEIFRLLLKKEEMSKKNILIELVDGLINDCALNSAAICIDSANKKKIYFSVEGTFEHLSSLDTKENVLKKKRSHDLIDFCLKLKYPELTIHSLDSKESETSIQGRKKRR